MHRLISGILVGLVGLVGSAGLRADDALDWVQLHAEISYVRTGTPATTTTGTFTYELHATVDQLMTRLPLQRGATWRTYVLPPEEYARTGQVAGSIQLHADGKFERYSGQANLKATLNSLDQIWIEAVKPQPVFFPGLGAEIKLMAKLTGTATSDLPGAGSQPATAVLLWPTPASYSDELAGFVSEGTVNVWPPFGPRPKDEKLAMIFDATKAMTDPSLPGVGSLTTPTATAELKGDAEHWELTMTAEAAVETGTGGHYTHKITAVIKPVPRTLKVPVSSEK